jgi:hypothetical protein
MFIAELDVTTAWANTVTNYLNGDDTFTIVNSSPGIIYAVEGDTAPSADVIGVPVQPGNYILYKKGSNAYLYLKNGYSPVVTQGVNTQSKTSRIIINKVG